MAPTAERTERERRWASEAEAEHYRHRRFRSKRHAERDPRRVAALLDRWVGKTARTLDAPCGTGRLRPVLAARTERWVGLDVAPAMLSRGAGQRIAGDVFRLPFRCGSFDLVSSCRFLHHLHSTTELDLAVRELVRVSSRFVVVTFWDTRALAEWSRRVVGRTPARRTARPRTELIAAFARAGARSVALTHSMPFFSRQAYALFERTP